MGIVSLEKKNIDKYSYLKNNPTYTEFSSRREKDSEIGVISSSNDRETASKIGCAQCDWNEVFQKSINDRTADKNHNMAMISSNFSTTAERYCRVIISEQN